MRQAQSIRKYISTWQYMEVQGYTWHNMALHCNTWQYMVNTVIQGNTLLYMAILGNAWQYMVLHSNTW